MPGGLYRRRTYPASNYTDDPDDVWSEFQRIRSHFMSLDQNNVLEDGVGRARIAKPNHASHEGLSDFLASAVAGSGSTDPMFDYETATTDTYAVAEDDGTWKVDQNVSIEGVARSAGFWIVAGSAQFNCGTATDHADVEVAVLSSRTGPAVGVGSGHVDSATLHCSPMGTSALLIPAGSFKLQLAVRVNWYGSLTASVSVSSRSIMAFGLYR